jgi:hypothetical protein
MLIYICYDYMMYIDVLYVHYVYIDVESCLINVYVFNINGKSLCEQTTGRSMDLLIWRL